MRIRVELPAHLVMLMGVPGREVEVEVGEATLRGVVEALELQYPMLRGTIRDQVTGERRAFLRFFACEEDLSHRGMGCALPEPVVRWREALLVIGAVAGG